MWSRKAVQVEAIEVLIDLDAHGVPEILNREQCRRMCDVIFGPEEHI